MRFIKIVFLIFLIQYIFGCVEKTTYSGKIITEKNLDVKVINKKDLLETFGIPSYIDSISNKYFYFTEKRKETNFYNKSIDYSYLFVFEINDDGKIINSETINLLTTKNHKYKNLETESNIVKRGLLEKVFGGIGPNQMPTSP